MGDKPNFDKETDLYIQHLMSVILSSRFSDLDKDYNACAELLEVSKKENYIYGMAFAYAYRGDCLIGRNEGVNASTDLMRAKELCEKYRFLDLLPYVCTWMGIYYEMQNDRQMAMHYYLDALEFAEMNHDLLRQSILLNNIASQFQNCGNSEVAKEYYVKAFQCFHEIEFSDTADPHFAQMTSNIISACCQLKQIDEAKYYYSLLKESDLDAGNKNQIFLCELLIAVAVGDINATHESVDKYLAEMKQKPKDLHQFFETLLVVAGSMITLNESEYSRKMLTVLNDLCKEDGYGHKLRVQYIWIEFYKIFGTQEEKMKAYEQFYELRKMSDDILNHNLADGLLSKIKLKESVKKNKEMQKKKEQLEGEVQLDELTQLYNRRSFRKLTERIASETQVYTLSFIMIDVDYFKQYNDTYGHQKGDTALREVADSMARASDGNVFNFRYGGDEFVSICKNKTVKEVEGYIEAFSEILYQKQIPHKDSRCSKYLTLSIGYSFHTKQEGAEFNTAELMAEADKALYRAKDLGRNRHCLYT